MLFNAINTAKEYLGYFIGVAVFSFAYFKMPEQNIAA